MGLQDGVVVRRPDVGEGDVVVVDLVQGLEFPVSLGQLRAGDLRFLRLVSLGSKSGKKLLKIS